MCAVGAVGAVGAVSVLGVLGVRSVPCCGGHRHSSPRRTPEQHKAPTSQRTSQHTTQHALQTNHQHPVCCSVPPEAGCGVLGVLAAVERWADRTRNSTPSLAKCQLIITSIHADGKEVETQRRTVRDIIDWEGGLLPFLFFFKKNNLNIYFEFATLSPSGPDSERSDYFWD